MSVHSFVDLASIPLYARAGPSLEVHCADAETTRWLQGRLLNRLWLEDVLEDEAKLSLIQCPLALLVNVDAPRTAVLYGGSSNVSDLLIYGVLSMIFPAAARPPPSPPDFSSLAAQDESALRTTVELRIYAAPLSGSYVQRVQSLPSPPSSPPEDTAAQIDGPQNDTHFFPDLRSPSPRRKRTLSIFEGAVQHHHQVRKRGGEAVSQLMAGPRSSSQSQSHHTITIKREPEDHSDRLGLRSRSVSIGSASMRGRISDGHMRQKSESQPQSSFTNHQLHRPTKQRESLVPDRPRSKSVVPSPLSPTQPFQPSGSPPQDAAAVLSQNKALITRTILTCMRLYGYHRKSNHHTTRDTPALKQDPEGSHDEKNHHHHHHIADTHEPDHQPPSSVGDEDEYRAMYHATYKAANFALRKYLKNDLSTVPPPVLTRETATNVVDGILKLFCEEH